MSYEPVEGESHSKRTGPAPGESHSAEAGVGREKVDADDSKDDDDDDENEDDGPGRKLPRDQQTREN